MGQKESREQTANEFIVQFHEKIPGAAKIEKIRVPDAKYCLVHIRMQHMGAWENNMTQREIEDSEKKNELHEIQKDIFSILHHLTARCALKELYLENISQGGEKLLMSLFGLPKIGRNKLRAAEQRQAELQKQLRDVQAALTKPFSISVCIWPAA